VEAVTDSDKEQPAFICSHVLNHTSPVLLVLHEGGDWQLLCGGVHDPDEVPAVAGINHLLERDPTLHEVTDLPDEHEAERSAVGMPWRRKPLPAG
jgi:hypothetical protein